MISRLSSWAWAAPLLLLFSLIGPCLPLRCYSCVSARSGPCGDQLEDVQKYRRLPGGGGYEGAEIDYMTTCPDAEIHHNKTHSPLCRTIFQNIRGYLSVVRSCGWEVYREKEDNCYKTVSEEYDTKVCQCFTDGCNGSSTVMVSVVLRMVGLAVTITV